MRFELQPAGSRFIVPGRDHSAERSCRFAFAIVGGHEAEEVARRIAEAHPDATPVILGTPEDASNVLDGTDSNSEMNIEGMLQAASQFDVDSWIAARAADLCDDEEPPLLPFGNSWPYGVTPTHTLDSLRDSLTRQPHEQVVIALLPTADPTAAAAHLKFGGWNDCPDPIVHIAFARRWRARY